MGFSIGNIFKSVVKNVAPAIFKAIAPGVSEKLASIADKFIGQAGSFAKGLVSGFPSPLKSLFDKLIDKGVAAGQDLSNPKTIQELLSKLAGMPREVVGAGPGAGPFTLPQVGSSERAQIHATGVAAATAGIAAMRGEDRVVGVPPGFRGVPSNGTNEDRIASALGSLTEPPAPGENPTEKQLFAYQQAQAKYNRMFEMYSKIMASAHELKRALIANFPR